ncbi:cysteine dioxygenase [Janibacter melonis]|uniref:cysteine dioxygenase n=1 Tax=Janibacter melonis TaxID=262209 RepID=UPI0020448237|nr:cysteine dioxygenase [Janibacter melonis]MCM3554319.1 cysteine dioxygenase [Janibacter melonis]
MPVHSTTADLAADARDLPPVQLLRLARLFAGRPGIADEATARPDADPHERTWLQLAGAPHLQVWLIRWPPGTSTGWHDHGRAVGAFTVVRGALTERTRVAQVQEERLGAGDGRAFGASHVHDVVNLGEDEAVSIHAYSPSLEQMTHYDLVDGRLRPAGVERREAW